MDGSEGRRLLRAALPLSARRLGLPDPLANVLSRVRALRRLGKLCDCAWKVEAFYSKGRGVRNTVPLGVPPCSPPPHPVLRNLNFSLALALMRPKFEGGD